MERAGTARDGPELEHLDARHTGYRFALESDLPWGATDAPGSYHPRAFLARLGLNVARLDAAGLLQRFDALLALATCRVFAHLERDVVAFVDEAGRDRPSRSARLLVEEEHKHIALFTRLGEALATRHPEEAAAMEATFTPPPSFAHLRARHLAAGGAADDAALAFTFWLNTVFFEEYTVFIHQALVDAAAADAVTLQPLWGAAHRVHRQEEAQHVLTDAAYLASSPLSDDARRLATKAFLLHLEQVGGAFLGVAQALEALRRFASRSEVIDGVDLAAPGRGLTSRPVWQDVLAHRAFRQTRAAAPWLTQTGSAPSPLALLDGGPPAIVLAPGDGIAARLARATRPLTFIEPDGGEVEVSPGALLDDARAALTTLQAHGAVVGDAVVVLTTRPRDTVTWFHACVQGGLVAAPLALPTTTEDSEELARLLRISAMLREPLMVVDDALVDVVAGLVGAQGGRVIAASSRGAAADARTHTAALDDVAFVQFSSGSMGDPRGVQLTHRNLLVDMAGMIAARGQDGDEVFVSWMPLFHDMGLIGYHLTPLFRDARQVLMSPFSFMRDPLSWLRALSRFGGTVTGGPTFALARLLPRLTADVVATLDLSRLHTFLVGAEPIAARVLEDFGRALAGAGLAPQALCPAYGLAEATLAVTMHPRGERPRVLTVRRASLDHEGGLEACAADATEGLALVELGPPLPGVRVRIVDDRGQVCPEGRVGTIELAGDTVTPGYLGDAPRAVDGWLDTGDLGVVVGGRLCVTGRKKDVFFVGGRNHYAHDVEAVVRELAGVHPGAVALVVDWNAKQGVDELVLCVAPQPEVDVPALLAEAARHVRARVGITVDRVVAIEKREITRTTSGKIKRRGLLQRLRAGAFEDRPTWRPGGLASTTPATATPSPGPSAPAADAIGLLSLVRVSWATVLGIPPDAVADDVEFRALGGDSLKAVQVHDALEQALGRPLGLELLAVGTTPTRMAAWLLREGIGPPSLSSPSSSASSSPSSPSSPSPARVTPRAPSSSDEIAVVALAVRVPGVATPSAWSDFLHAGRTTLGPIPAARLREARLSDPARLGVAGWFPTIDTFDPGPFGLHDAEARALGPAQRLLLELAFDLLADVAVAGRTGVFVGVGGDGYGRRYVDDAALVTGHSLLGALPNMAAARVARTFGLRGPALTVDTACSSSLVAVHLGARSLQQGECDVAIVGGAQIGLEGSLLASFERAGLLSRTGRCQPFDEDGAGLVPGEGGALFALKRLADAVADGDAVLALVAGSAMNNDGAALSATAPSPAGQRDVIAAAWWSAGLALEDAAFLEAHAAGTAVGDAVEVAALAPLLTRRISPLPIGSVKGHVGHTLAAAGALGMARALLALRERRWSGSVGLQKPTRRVDFAAARLEPASAASRTLAAGPLCCGVSSFGLGGTNAHVVLLHDERCAPRAPAADTGGPRLLVAGGLDDADVAQVAADLRLRIDGGSAPDDLVAASAGRADLLPARRAVVLPSSAAADVAAGFATLAASSPPRPGRRRGGRVAFVFAGPGSQIPTMGRALAAWSPVFREALDACAAVGARHGLDLRSLLHADGGADAPIHRLALAQPAVFSMGYALSVWLRHLGVEPALVLGHSAGEYAALQVAGALSLDDALSLVIARGRAMAAAAPGRMMAVMASAAVVGDAIRRAGLAGRVGVAAENAPAQVSVSGTETDVLALQQRLDGEGLACRLLDVDCAAHSERLDAADGPFAAAVAGVTFHLPTLPWLSTTTARIETAVDAAHCRRHLTAPVRFMAAIRAAREAGIDTFVELSATAGLSTCIRQILLEDGGDADDIIVTSCGAREDTGLGPPLQALATLIDAGLPVRASRAVRRSGAAAADVAPWRWRRRRLWIDLPDGPTSSSTNHGWALSIDDEPALRDHVTGGVCSAPASLLVDRLAEDAGREGGELADIVVLRPLVVRAGERRVVEHVVVPDLVDAAGQPRRDAREVRSRGDDGDAIVHLTARVARARGRSISRLDLDAIRARLDVEVAATVIYDRLDRTGFVMGPAMRAVQQVMRGEDELLAELATPAGGSAGRFVDAALLDGASHAVAAFFVDTPADDGIFLGFAMERVRLHRPVHGRCLAWVRLRPGSDAATLRYDVTLVDDDGEVLAEVTDFVARRRSPGASSLPPSPSPPPPPSLTLLPTTSSSLPSPSPPAAGPTTRAGLEALITTLVAERLRRAPSAVPLHAPLARLGVDSLMAVDLVRRLEARLGLRLWATLLFEATTVAEVAARVADVLASEEGRSR